MNIFTLYANYRRQQKAKSLINQITKIHPELNDYHGQAKMDRYTLLAFQLLPEQRDPTLGQRPKFNEVFVDLYPRLRHEVLAYLSVESAAYYHAELIKMTIQLQDADQLLKEQKQLIKAQEEIIENAKLITQQANQAIQQINQAAQPGARLN